MEIEVEGVPEPEEQMNIFVMDDIGYKTIDWAVAFVLVAKLLRLVLILGYAWLLLKFRAAHLVQAVIIAVPCFCFLPLFGVRSISTASPSVSCSRSSASTSLPWPSAGSKPGIPKRSSSPPKKSATQSRRPRRPSCSSAARSCLVRCWIPPLHAVC